MSTEPVPRRSFARELPGRLRRGLATIRKRRSLRVARHAAGLLAVVYALLIAYPGLLFAHEFSYGSFRVESDEPIEPQIVAVLDDAAARLARSSLNEPAMVHRLFLCNTRLRLTLLLPRSRGAFGVTFAPWIRGNTFLNRVDIPSNSVYRHSASNNRRPLGSVIAHERTHALMDRHFGTVACIRMPEWKREGYCEYVGGNPSLDVEEGKRLLREGRIDSSGPFRYFRAYAMVTYLLDIEGLTIDEIVAREFDEPSLIAKVRANVDRLRL